MPFKSKAQQRFMFATMPKTAEKWAKHTPDIKGLPQHVKKEELEQEHWDHPGCEDKVGEIFVVLRPGPESSPEDLVHKTHAFGMGQFEPQGVQGVYNDENEANLVAEAACTELRKHLEEVERKKHTAVNKIDKIIEKLQREINAHMKEASEVPETADKAHEAAEGKMGMIKNLREKRKMVEAAKKPLPEKEEK